jgi:hypothetical protein
MGQVTLADDPEARVDMAPVIDVTSSPDIPLTPGDLERGCSISFPSRA